MWNIPDEGSFYSIFGLRTCLRFSAKKKSLNEVSIIFNVTCHFLKNILRKTKTPTLIKLFRAFQLQGKNHAYPYASLDL